MKRGGPLKRSAPLQRKPFRRRSSQKRTERTEAWWHHDVWERVMRRDKDCRARLVWPHDCDGHHQVHHVRLKKQGGDDAMGNLIRLCPVAHTHAHAHPTEAMRLGLIQGRKVMPEWSDLSDAELRRRLIQRDVPTEVAIALVARRDEGEAALTITEALQ